MVRMSPGVGKKLSPSQEDYLEAVLDLVRTGQVARVRDIARRLGVGMPSVTVALRALSSRGLVNYDPYEVVTLTEAGQRTGEEIERRHRVLQSFLTDVLGLDESTARANACRMEHAVDVVVLERLSALMERLEHQPPAASHKPHGKGRTGGKR
jgi:DtxR family Mn-dependent transcriptional regulator